MKTRFHITIRKILTPDGSLKPIAIEITVHTTRSPEASCADFLDTERWSEFSGYFILPGIKKAEFEVSTPEMVGSKIRVYNSDGSTHVEEIIAWDAPNRITVKFHAFQPPLQFLATHFIETWEFRRCTHGTDITRRMSMYPKSQLARMLLLPIAFLMKRAFENQLRRAQA